jgi:hypothetical protein
MATVSPYDTLQLVATPLDENDDPIATTARATYAVNDTSLVIDSVGLMRVHWSNSNLSGIQVVAQLTVNGQTLADTALVSITAGMPTRFMDSLILRPVIGDSARRSVLDAVGNKQRQTLTSPVARTAAGLSIPNASVYFTSSDTLIASFLSANTSNAPRVIANAPGQALLKAEATVYGKRLEDSLWYTAGYSLGAVYAYGIPAFSSFVLPQSLVNTWATGTVRIAQGGAVLWGNSITGQADDSLDVQFDDSTAVAGLTVAKQFLGLALGNLVTIPAGSGGNIMAFPAAVVTHDTVGNFYYLRYDSLTAEARVFPQPGTYHWVSRHQGISGNVVVIANDSIKRW